MEKEQEFTSWNYHLINGMYNWITENDMLPNIVIPMPFVQQNLLHLVKDGVLILNISMSATSGLEITRESITFSARFSGKPHNVVVPIDGVAGVFPRERPDLGINIPVFVPDDYVAPENGTVQQTGEPETKPRAKSQAKLTVVK